MSGQVWGHCTGWRRPLVGPVWVQSAAHLSGWGCTTHFQKMGSPSWLCIVCPLPQLSPPSKGSHGMGQLWGILALSWHWDSVDDSCLGSDHRRQRSSIQAAVVQWSYCVWVLGSAHWCTQHCSTSQLKDKSVYRQWLWRVLLAKFQICFCWQSINTSDIWLWCL